MSFSARPLLDTAADQVLFVGREDVLRKIDRSIGDGLNTLVIGDPGSGKTSLVRALMFGAHLADRDLRFSFARAGTSRSAAELLAAVLTAVRGRRGRSLPGGDGRSTAPLDLLDELADAVGQARETQPGRLVIVVDDVTATAGAEVFGALRDELWQQVDAQWLVTTSGSHAPGLLRPPADAFFETRIELPALSVAESTELLKRRFDQPAEPGRAEVIRAAATGGAQTPRRLIELARELAAEPTVGGGRLNTLKGWKARQAALVQLSRPARMLAGELDALGWASASDELLLGRLGWTRPRVIQVIAELEGRGLVQMREEKTGRGRPRKLYRLTPAVEFVDPSPPGPST